MLVLLADAIQRSVDRCSREDHPRLDLFLCTNCINVFIHFVLFTFGLPTAIRHKKEKFRSASPSAR